MICYASRIDQFLKNNKCNRHVFQLFVVNIKNEASALIVFICNYTNNSLIKIDFTLISIISVSVCIHVDTTIQQKIC